MKNIVGYIGGGLLAAVIGTGMFGIAQDIGRQESSIEKLLPEEAEDNLQMEASYEKAIQLQQVVVIYKPYTSCVVGKQINLEDCFLARDGQGCSKSLKVTEVRLHNTDVIVTPGENGMWTFKQAGIYQVTIECGNRNIQMNIPVNG